MVLLKNEKKSDKSDKKVASDGRISFCAENDELDMGRKG
jgi:hypothetical protein